MLKRVLGPIRNIQGRVSSEQRQQVPVLVGNVASNATYASAPSNTTPRQRFMNGPEGSFGTIGGMSGGPALPSAGSLFQRPLAIGPWAETTAEGRESHGPNFL